MSSGPFPFWACCQRIPLTNNEFAVNLATMRGFLRVTFGAIVLLAVLAIFLCPATHVPRTALRSMQAAALIFLTIWAVATTRGNLLPSVGAVPFHFLLYFPRSDFAHRVGRVPLLC